MDIGVICPLVLIRKALCTLLSRITDVQVVMDADAVIDSFQLLEQLSVDIVLLDSFGQVRDVEDIRLLNQRFPKTKIMLLSDTVDADFEVKAVRMGARG